MLLMDRTKINWSVLDKISSQGKQMGLLYFLEVGCCALHAVHGAFQTGACWIEDKRVAANTLEIWPNIVDIIKHFESLAPSKQPKNNKS